MATPALEALLADRAALDEAHGRARSLAEEWRHSPPYRWAMTALMGLDAADADQAAARATLLLADTAWVGALLKPLVAALAQDPLAEPPFRVQRDALKLGAVLIDHPAMTITASVLSATALAELPAAATLVVPGKLSVVRYHRGSGHLLLWRTGPVAADFGAATASPCRPASAVRLTDGLVRRIDGRTHAQLIEPLSDIVTLTATIHAGAAPISRQYDRTSGRFLRAAALDDWPSRAELMLAFLRHAGRSDAADAFDVASRDTAHFLRWAAMREWLALDAAAALPRLREMTGDPHPEVRAAARTMLAKVMAPCPV